MTYKTHDFGQWSLNDRDGSYRAGAWLCDSFK